MGQPREAGRSVKTLLRVAVPVVGLVIPPGKQLVLTARRI
jgi:hypothetical protein